MQIESFHALLVDPNRRVASIPLAAKPKALILGSLIAMVALAPTARAQGSGKGFLFSKPVGSFSLRGGYAMANAGSDVFDDATSQLTLDKRDFSGWSWGGDISYAAMDRVDLVFDGEVSSTSKDSEFRNFVDNNDQPIEQGTKFKRVPLTIGLKYYLMDRGRSISQYAYVPAKFAPFVSVGGGAMYYKFEQKGDFIDFNTEEQAVVPLTIEGSGWTPMADGTAGFDYTLGPWLALTTQVRYDWAKAKLDPDTFVGYDKIDLTGFTGTLGFRVRF